MENIIKELPALISSYAGAITGVAAAIAVIVGYRVKTKKRRTDRQRKDLGIPVIEEKVENIQTEIAKYHEEAQQTTTSMYNKMKELDDAQDDRTAQQFNELTELIKSFQRETEDKMNDSEMERLRDKIYEAAEKARQGLHISGEYYARTRDILTKYEGLGGDGTAHAEWDFFQKYYNKQKSQSNS